MKCTVCKEEKGITKDNTFKIHEEMVCTMCYMEITNENTRKGKLDNEEITIKIRKISKEGRK